MNKINSIPFLILFFLSCSSCKRYHYYPSQQNVLRFKEKGDLNMALGKDEARFDCLNFGYSFTNNFAFITDYKENSDNYLWDNELIVYKTFDSNIQPALNIGYGFGQADIDEVYYSTFLYRQFLQPSVGFSGKFIEIAFSFRFAHVNYKLIKLKDFRPGYEDEMLGYLDFRDVGKKDFYFVEPALTLGIKYKAIKLTYQKSIAQNISLSNIRYLDNNVTLSLSLIINFYRIFNKFSTPFYSLYEERDNILK